MRQQHGVSRQEQRQHTNAKLRWQASADTRVTVVGHVFDQPESGDPLGLTRERFEADPRQAVANATLYKAGKDVFQNQLGLVVDRWLDARSDVSVRVYAGQRHLGQPPLHSAARSDVADRCRWCGAARPALQRLRSALHAPRARRRGPGAVDGRAGP